MSDQICAKCTEKLTTAEVLSAREMQILTLLSAGHKAKAIGRILFVSDKTVESHRARIKRKMGVTTAVEWMTLLKSVDAPAQVGHGG